MSDPDHFGEPQKPRAAGLVRLARRAGRVVVGIALTRSAVRAGRAAAVLIAEDLQATRRDALIERWRAAGLPVFRGWTKDELGELAGKPAVAALAVTDRNIAAGLADLASGPPAGGTGSGSPVRPAKEGEKARG